MESGYWESTESWAEVLRDLRDRGLAPPLLAVGDGALGLWSALSQVFPTTEHQRCWNHRVLNVQSKLPQRLQAGARQRLPEIAEAETQALGEERRDGYVAELRSLGQGAAAEIRLRRTAGLGRLRHLLSLSQKPALSADEGNTGCIYGPATPWSPSSAGSGCGPMRPGECALGTTLSTWCSRSWSGSVTTGEHCMEGRT